MKSFLFILAFILCSKFSDGQNITLDQFIAMRTKSLTAIEEYLTAKNWEMLEAVDETDESLGFVRFAYKKQLFDDKAESFINYYYSVEPNVNNRLKIQVNTVKTYNLYMARIKALGYSLLGSKIEDGNIIKAYQLYNNTVEITTSVQEDFSASKTVYTFFIWNSNDYKLHMASKEN